MLRQIQWILFLCLGGALLLGMTVIPGFGANELFSDAGDAQVAALQAGTTKPDPTVARTRYVKINFDQLRGNQFPDGAGSILLNLYSDLSYSATKGRLEKRSATRYTWFGRIDGAALSQVVLVVEDGVMAGNIMVNGELYQVRAVGEGIHAVRKIDQSKFPEEAPSIPVHSAPDQSELLSASPGADDGSTIDVLVVYTPAAAGASSSIMAEIQLGIDETNQSYANSGIAQRVRLVHAAQVNYTETGNGDTDLTRLQNPSDGYVDEVHALRDAYGADVVSLWVENLGANTCGIGYLMTSVSSSFKSYAFSVVARSCATGYYSFGHEMGHNMGATHDRYVNDGDGAYPYSHGYVNTQGKWRTVMAYNNKCSSKGYNCTRIPYWSNPRVSYQGTPTGISQNVRNSANNVLTLNNTAYTVANFRPSVENPLPMVAMMENPQNGKTVSGITTIHGWAIDGKGITNVDLFIDGQSAGTIPYGGSRKDVKTAHPDYPNADNSGFGVIFNYSILSSGNHTISVKVHNQDGNILPLDSTVTVKKFQGEFVDNMNPGVWSLSNSAVTVGGITKNYDIQIKWFSESQSFGITDVTPK